MSDSKRKREASRPKAVYTVAPSVAAGESEDSSGYDKFNTPPPEPPPPVAPPVQPPAFRPLRVYAFDSTRGEGPGNIITLQVRYEKLKPGPVGRRIQVIDYDGSRDCFYDPVDLDDPLIAMQNGVQPSESDPHFHQQMVYAVTSETLRRFEAALGRSIEQRTPKGTIPLRIDVYPHAMRIMNAYYGGSGRMIFGYFPASEAATGRIVPGQTLFTCLSHDVVVHVATHALLDAIRPDFTSGGGDTYAFMEGFCDLCAMLLHYSHRDALLDTIQRTGGLIYRSVLRADGETTAATPQIQAELAENNPLIGLATSFGEARGKSGGLRSAIAKPDPKALETATEPHARGEILLAAIFDAFFSVYVRRSQGLFRVYRSGGGRVDSADLPYPLAESLAGEVQRVADRVFNTCIRALDYCPPPPLQFGDYLRACITADSDYDPSDAWGVRDAFMQAFRRRGIKPEGAPFFTDEALRWPAIDPKLFKSRQIKLVGLPDPDAAARQQNQVALHKFIVENAPALMVRPKADFDLYPLEMSRWTTADESPHMMLCAFTSQKKGKQSTGVTLVFDAAGMLRHAIRKS